MTRRDWWLGVSAVTLGVVFHAVFPRYEWRNYQSVPIIRVDRWTGRSVRGSFADGPWTAVAPQGVPPKPPEPYVAGYLIGFPPNQVEVTPTQLYVGSTLILGATLLLGGLAWWAWRVLRKARSARSK